jgi:DNA-binding transcriptional ArsR family regulator
MIVPAQGPEPTFSPPRRGGDEKEKFAFTRELPFGPMSEKLADVPIEPEWTWDGYLLPRGLTLFAGRPKIGKSTLTFALIRALSLGERFLERAARATGVLLLSEERPDSLTEKMDRFGVDGAVHLLMRHEAKGVPWPEIVAQAVACCQERNLGVLVIDTWDKWTGLRGDAENKSGDVLEALEPLADAAASGLAVLVIAHQRKSGGEFGEAVRGSNALTSGVDVVLELERPSASLETREGTRILRAVSRFSATPDELIAVLVDDRYEVESAPISKSTARRTRLLDALKRLGEPTVKELAMEANVPESTISRYLSKLKDEGAAEVLPARSGEKAARWKLTFSSPNSLSGEKENGEEVTTLWQS